MKRYRILTFWLIAAAMLAACDPHEFPVSEYGDPLRDFSLRLTFDDELPVHRQITASTKAGGSPAARYTVMLYRYGSGPAFGLDPDYTYTFTRDWIADLDTTIFLPINPDRYRVAGWVDWGDYSIADPEKILLARDYAPGENARDAFAFSTNYDVEGYLAAGEPYSKTVILRRPVAQLRFIAPEALTFLAETGIDASAMKATLRYTSDIPDGYNLLADRLVGSRSDVTLTAVPRMDASGELVFLSDFIFSTDEGTSVTVEFTLTGADGKEIAVYAGKIPLRRAHVTTVSFTSPSGGGENKPGGIGIDPGFEGEIEVPI